jgi:hypothetical protein
LSILQVGTMTFHFSMTLEELYKLKDSLEELIADPEIDFGPAYEMTKIRKSEALKIVNREIRRLKNEDKKYVKSQLGYSRVGRNNI